MLNVQHDYSRQSKIKGEPANFAIQVNNSTPYLAIVFMTLFYTSMALHTIMMRAEKKVNYSHQGADGNARMCDKSPAASWNLCVPINRGYIEVACSLRVLYTLLYCNAL